MLIQIDPSSDLPLYEQLIRQMTFLIAQGAYRADELVPSVREVSKTLAVNPNTVVRAYRQLQDDGVLVAQRGTGMAVSARGVAKCRDARERILRERVRGTVAELRQSGLSDAEIALLVLDQLDRNNIAVDGVATEAYQQTSHPEDNEKEASS